MKTLNEYFIDEAQENMIRIQGEVVADTATYWDISERLQCVYDGDTGDQYKDMMLQLKALNGIYIGNGCIKGIKADIERYKAEDLEYIA
tara:strand:+ start:239 stop:505 length:267 start_codon:yes stop_codon:yes gene_type:complete